MDAPQVIADSLEEARSAILATTRAVEEVERERRAEMRRVISQERHKAREEGKRIGYRRAMESMEAKIKERESNAYAAGFADGAKLASKMGKSHAQTR